MSPKIIFSILNRNGVSDTIACVQSLLASTYQEFHISVLDNGSAGDDRDILQKTFGKETKVTLHRSTKNLGFTGGNNYNLQLLTNKSYKYVGLLNNDCVVTQNFLGDFIHSIDSITQDGIFGPVIHNTDGSIQSSGSQINLRLGSNPRLESITKKYSTVDCVSGSCFCISKKVIEKVGFLDDRFFAYWEESDYCMRAKKLGYMTYILDSKGITHAEKAATDKKKPYYTYFMFRNRILFLKKHASGLQYLVSWIFLLGYICIVCPWYFGWGNFRYIWRGVWDGVKGRGGRF